MYGKAIVQQTITTLKILPITEMKLEGFLPMGGTPLAIWPIDPTPFKGRGCDWVEPRLGVV
jgi:hypothetical protein